MADVIAIVACMYAIVFMKIGTTLIKYLWQMLWPH